MTQKLGNEPAETEFARPRPNLVARLRGEADGPDVVIRVEPREEFQLSDITSGPVLFATC